MVQTNWKTSCEEHGDDEPFANGLEDRNEEQSCKRTGRQAAKNMVTKNLSANGLEDRNDGQVCERVGRQARGLENGAR